MIPGVPDPVTNTFAEKGVLGAVVILLLLTVGALCLVIKALYREMKECRTAQFDEARRRIDDAKEYAPVLQGNKDVIAQIIDTVRQRDRTLDAISVGITGMVREIEKLREFADRKSDGLETSLQMLRETVQELRDDHRERGGRR